MLQAIRSKATSFIVKVLFGLLIITFGIWGIADIFNNRSQDTTVATVGGVPVTMDQMAMSVRNEMDRLQQVFGKQIDAAQAKQLGVVQVALDRVVNADLVDLEVDRLHLAIGADVVRQVIIETPAFHNQSGVFDRNVYASVVANSHMSMQQYEDFLRAELLRDQMTSAFLDGWTPPAELVDALYRVRFEHRIADTVTLPPGVAGPTPAPTEEQLQGFYKEHAEDFRNPERRSFTLALLTAQDVMAGITVPEDKLKQEYQAREAEFHTPEQRQLQQILVSDQSKAKEAETQLAAGKDFAAVAKAVADVDPAALELGWMKRTDLPPELATAAFALKVGETTPPIQSTFGWHILRLETIKPEETQSLDQVKDKLTKEAALDIAGDQIAQSANQIDDALAGGASLADVAQKFALRTVNVVDVDSTGRNSEGKSFSVPNVQQLHDIVATAFATDSGQTSDLTQLGEDGYYIVHIDKITPAAPKPFADVRDDVVKGWQNQARSAALLKFAEQLAAEVNAGKSLKDVAAAHKFTVVTTEPLERSTSDKAKDKGLPPTLLSKIFEAKLDHAVTEPVGNSVMIAQLTSVEPADPTKDAAVVKKQSGLLQGSMHLDLITEFEAALRQRFPVDINQTNLDRVL